MIKNCEAGADLERTTPYLSASLHLYLSLFFVLVPLSTIRCHVNDYNHLLNVYLSSSPQVNQIGELQAKGKILW